jgi:hypothetical protein
VLPVDLSRYYSTYKNECVNLVTPFNQSEKTTSIEKGPDCVFLLSTAYEPKDTRYGHR